MVLHETPISTFNFMLLGFGVILGIMTLFLISLVARFRNLRRDLELLQEIETDERT